MASAVQIPFITEGTVLVKPPALPLLAHIKRENDSVAPSCILTHHHAHEYQEACLPGLRIVNVLILEKYSYKGNVAKIYKACCLQLHVHT